MIREAFIGVCIVTNRVWWYEAGCSGLKWHKMVCDGVILAKYPQMPKITKYAQSSLTRLKKWHIISAEREIDSKGGAEDAGGQTGREQSLDR